MIYAVIAIQTLLVLVDGFPKVLSLIGIVSHAVYLGNMRRFPIVKLSDPLFLSSCGMLCSDYTMERVLTIHSSCPHQPLLLLRPLLQPPKSSHELHLRCARRSFLHGDCILLWDMRVARSICVVR